MFNQLDPKWRGVRLGRTWATLARYGCTTFSISKLSERFGSYRSPIDIAGDARHYTRTGLLKWESVVFDGFHFVKRLRRRNLKEIDNWIRAGRGVLLELNFGAHWVLAIRKEGNNYIALDSLTGGEINVLERYRYITGSAHFEEN